MARYWAHPNGRTLYERLACNLHKCQGHESQERQRNCPRLKETRETQYLGVVCVTLHHFARKDIGITDKT